MFITQFDDMYYFLDLFYSLINTLFFLLLAACPSVKFTLTQWLDLREKSYPLPNLLPIMWVSLS
jgi:hypothetical protein